MERLENVQYVFWPYSLASIIELLHKIQNLRHYGTNWASSEIARRARAPSMSPSPEPSSSPLKVLVCLLDIYYGGIHKSKLESGCDVFKKKNTRAVLWIWQHICSKIKAKWNQWGNWRFPCHFYLQWQWSLTSIPYFTLQFQDWYHYRSANPSPPSCIS